MKRVYCVLLTVLLLLSLALPAGALAFSDAAGIAHLDAVTVMVDLGLVSGYENGTFLPRNNIRRAEAAKLIALIAQKEPRSSGSVAFRDVPASFWAANYVAFCAEKGIISGHNGRFRPNDYVKGREFAKMLLVCLGNDGRRYSGSAWEENVDTDARAQGIYLGFGTDPGAYLSRDGACLLMYNAMQSYAVSGTDSNGQKIYVTDQLMNPVTYMEHRFGVVKYAGILEANEYADLTQPAGRLEAGWSKLQGHLPFAVTTSYDLLGRMVEIYTVRQGESYRVIGIPHLAGGDEQFVTTDEQTFLAAQLHDVLPADERTVYFYNGSRADETLFGRLGADCRIVAVNRSGTDYLDTVLVTDYCSGTVTATNPLTIASGNVSLPGGFFGESRELELGEIVRCAAVGGRFLVEN